MLKYLIRNAVRKILKRKDSDAGDKARALDDVRASLSSKFRSLGGGKRQQQPLLGATAALTFNFLASVMALAVVSIGVAVATVNDLQFHWFGACIAIAWIIPSAANKILWSNFQQQENWTALALMWKSTPITLFFLAILIPFLDPPGALSFNWNAYNSAMIGGSAVLGFLLQWSGALALGATSAITPVVLGQFKTCGILLGGYLLFGSNPGTTSIFGATMTLGGMSLYTYLNLRAQQESLKSSARQSTLVLSQSKLGKENRTDHDWGRHGDESV